MTLSVFFILSRLSWLSSVFSSVMTQMIERMFGPLAFILQHWSRWYDWAIMDYALVCWLLVQFFFRGASLRGLGDMARSLPLSWQLILFGLFIILINSFSQYHGLGFCYITFEYNIWWAVLSHFLCVCDFPRLALCGLSCGRGLGGSKWCSSYWFRVMIDGSLRLNDPAIKAYIQA